jgi:hypothetical protein
VQSVSARGLLQHVVQSPVGVVFWRTRRATPSKNKAVAARAARGGGRAVVGGVRAPCA